MEEKTIEQLRKEQNKGNSQQTIPLQKKEVKKTLGDEFIEELDNEEKEIFLELKSILLDTCGLLEFEAVTEESLEDFTAIITYVKNGVIVIENDGLLFKVRKPLKNSDGKVLTSEIKLLYERNESRERVFTKRIKVNKKDIESQKEYTRACLAAAFDKVNINGTDVIITMANTRSLHSRDYMLLLTCFNFFRN